MIDCRNSSGTTLIIMEPSSSIRSARLGVSLDISRLRFLLPSVPAEVACSPGNSRGDVDDLDDEAGFPTV